MNNLQIFGYNIPIYGFLGLCGVILGGIYTFIIAKRKNVSFDNLLYVLVYALVFALFGAKLLYLLLNLKSFASLWSAEDIDVIKVILVYLRGGFVFYGGLFGAIFGIYVSCKYFNFQFSEYVNILIPAMPLIHSLGRLGCLAVGCCYGKETDSYCYIIYTHSQIAPNGIPLFPVQLFEALIDLVIFVILLYIVLSERIEVNSIYIYLFLYSSVRFFLEFLRGDKERGVYFLSTSQWISLFILVFLFIKNIMYMRKSSLRKKQYS